MKHLKTFNESVTFNRTKETNNHGFTQEEIDLLEGDGFEVNNDKISIGEIDNIDFKITKSYISEGSYRYDYDVSSYGKLMTYGNYSTLEHLIDHLRRNFDNYKTVLTKYNGEKMYHNTRGKIGKFFNGKPYHDEEDEDY